MLENAYLSPFSPAYGRRAAGELRSLRMLILAAVFVALEVVISSFFVPVGENLRIYFKFLVTALGASIYGPVLALCTGLVGDLVGALVHPSGPFFPGYTLSSMLGSFFFALFLYRTRITVIKLFLSKALVNLLVNLLLGSLWSMMLMGKAFYYYFAKSLVKNLAMLPVEVALLVLLFGVMLPILNRAGFGTGQARITFR